MFTNAGQLRAYIEESFLEVTDSRIDEDHWDLLCGTCRITRGFQLLRRQSSISNNGYQEYAVDHDAPVTYVFRCPVCKSFKQWILYTLSYPRETKVRTKYFRVTSVPSEGIEDIAELPDNPPALRMAYKQAVRSMDANAYLAAAAMFRRALQVITREMLGAKPGNLANELNEVTGKSYKGSTPLTTNFAEVAYIIKEAGNQASHPDKDPDLLDFTAEDAKDLQKVFLELVSELFVIPEVVRKAKQEFLDRRKISPLTRSQH